MAVVFEWRAMGSRRLCLRVLHGVRSLYAYKQRGMTTPDSWWTAVDQMPRSSKATPDTDSQTIRTAKHIHAMRCMYASVWNRAGYGYNP